MLLTFLQSMLLGKLDAIAEYLNQFLKIFTAGMVSEPNL